MNFEATRLENDERLLSQIESIRSGKNIQVLVQFAKAYLGMFYVIDSELAAKDKVRLLANDMLAEAVFQGFLASLTSINIPRVEKIGFAMAEQNEIAEGYVILAGLDLLASNSMHNVFKLPQAIIQSAIAFYFSNPMNHANNWFADLLREQKTEVAITLKQYWVAMLNNNAVYLPGIDLVLGSHPDIDIAQKCILPLLLNWKNCKDKTLYKMLQLAFKYSNTEELLRAAETILENDEQLTERKRLYWIATVYLLAPEKYYAKLSGYVGRVKIKVMPLLDFITQVMKDEKSKVNFNDRLTAELIRLVAPVFPPQHHVYGSLGGLDINSKNVMLLFYKLACSRNQTVQHELKTLRKVRVMKIYSGVIDYLLDLHLRKNSDTTFVMPDYETFIANLYADDLLHGKSNRFDLR